MCLKPVHNDCPFDPPPKKLSRKDVTEAIFWAAASLILAILITYMYVHPEEFRLADEPKQIRPHW